MRVVAPLLFVLALTLAVAARAEPATWTVRGPGGGEVLLYGSAHVLPPGTVWRTPALDRALGQADEIWFEVPPDTPADARVAAVAAQLGRLPPGPGLSERLTPEGRARLARLMRRFTIAPGALDRARPWWAELALSQAWWRVSGAGAGRGLEETIAAAAPAGVRVMSLETPAAELRAFAAPPMGAQLASLELALREMDGDPDAWRRLSAAWAAGDLCAVTRQAVSPLQRAARPVYESLVAARSRRWADRIAELAGSGRNTVVVVGVGHLVGPDGLPALLRRRGLEVDGPTPRCSS